MPVRHTYEEVREFTEYVASLTKSESNSKNTYLSLIRPITEKRKNEIRRWIENEVAMCALDCGYWEDNYAFVCDEKGIIFKFKNRKSQAVFDSVISDFDEQQVSIEILCLKGRQVGITTKVALKFIHRMLFIPHTQAVMASVQRDKSDLIERILNTAYSRCPWWLVPRKLPKKQFDNGSILSIQSGMQATGIAQGWTPQCLVPGSLVRVGNGFVKPIEQVEKGDSVITHLGETVKVKAAFETKRGQDVTRILKLWGHYKPLECTLDHRIDTPDGWVEAAEISVGDYVRHPVRSIAEETSSFESYTMPRGKVREDKRRYFYINLSPELGYLCGFYLAEGSIHCSAINHPTKKPYISEVTFAVHTREIEHRVAAIKSIVGDQYAISVKKISPNGAKISVSCAWLARWIAENFGRTTKKTIPDWVWTTEYAFCRELVHGYIDGDGHRDKQSNNVVALSICSAVILQMRDLIASLGWGWSSIYVVKDNAQRGTRRKDTWRLVLSGSTGYTYRKVFGYETKSHCKNPRHWRYSKDKSSIEIMVESASNGISDRFYDIEVEDDAHSFTTDQCAVHNCIHISEISLIPNPKETIEEGLLPATHSSKNLFMVFEGTGAGNVGWFPDYWRDSKKNWPLGKSRMCPVFISWPLATDLYPQEDWLRKYPVPGNFNREMLDATRKHVARCESYIRNTPYLAKVAGKDYTMPIEQRWYWEFEYRQAKERHTLQKFAARMPADDFEALTGVHDSVFDGDIFNSVESEIYDVQTIQATGEDIRTRKQKMQAYAITGHSIPEKFDPDASIIDWDKEVVRITWISNRGERYDWEMIPLLSVNEDIESETMDKLLVYEEPQEGEEYSEGIDTAHGLGKEDEDRTCISLTKKGDGAHFDLQVCELTSNRLSPAQTVPFAACIAAWYGKRCRDPRGVKFSIEQVEGPGDTCQNQLKIMGFNYHVRPGRLDGKKVKDENKNREGWYSNRVTVPILMGRFVEAVDGGWYKPRSRWLIEELKTLERHIVSGGKDKMEHRSGQHDDRVRAAAQSYLSFHTYDDLAARAQSRYAAPQTKKPGQKGICKANMITVGVDGWED